MITFFCGNCGKKLESEEKYQGMNVECPYCKTSSFIPAPQRGKRISNRLSEITKKHPWGMGSAVLIVLLLLCVVIVNLSQINEAAQYENSSNSARSYTPSYNRSSSSSSVDFYSPNYSPNSRMTTLSSEFGSKEALEETLRFVKSQRIQREQPNAIHHYDSDGYIRGYSK